MQKPLEEITFLNIATGNRELFYRQVEEMVNRHLISIPHEVIERQMLRLRTPEDFGGNIPEYAKRVAWFGRKFGYALKDANGGSSDSSSPLKELYTELDSMRQTEG